MSLRSMRVLLAGTALSWQFHCRPQRSNLTPPPRRSRLRSSRAATSRRPTIRAAARRRQTSSSRTSPSRAGPRTDDRHFEKVVDRSPTEAASGVFQSREIAFTRRHARRRGEWIDRRRDDDRRDGARRDADSERAFAESILFHTAEATDLQYHAARTSRARSQSPASTSKPATWSTTSRRTARDRVERHHASAGRLPARPASRRQRSATTSSCFDVTWDGSRDLAGEDHDHPRLHAQHRATAASCRSTA